ncbi:MAG: hypothetical protein ACK2TW_01905, partial [Anaerolineales bacterium]
IADEFFTRIDPVELTCLFVSSKLLFNLSSLPAISIPCRKTKTSLSIGLQIVVGMWKEKGVSITAYAF